MHILFFFKQKTAYEMRISDWSSDVCSSDLDDPSLPRRDAGLVHRCTRAGQRVHQGRAPAARDAMGAGGAGHLSGRAGHVDRDLATQAVGGDRPSVWRHGDFRLVVMDVAEYTDRKSTLLNSSHYCDSSMPSSA